MSDRKERLKEIESDGYTYAHPSDMDCHVCDKRTDHKDYYRRTDIISICNICANEIPCDGLKVLQGFL